MPDKWSMDDYIDVAERLAILREKHPTARVRPLNPARPFEIVTVGERTFVVVVSACYLTPDDPNPGVGMAWEPIPGPTQFTRDSELQNAETASWGRAIVAAGVADTKRGIASKQEVRNRRGPEKPQESRNPRQDSAPQPASDEAKGTIVELLGALPEGERQAANETLENSGGAGWLDSLTADQASKTIGWLRRRHDALRASVEA